MAKSPENFFWKMAHEAIIDAMTIYFQDPDCAGERETTVMELIGYCSEMASKTRIVEPSLDTEEE